MQLCLCAGMALRRGRTCDNKSEGNWEKEGATLIIEARVSLIRISIKEFIIFKKISKSKKMDKQAGIKLKFKYQGFWGFGVLELPVVQLP